MDEFESHPRPASTPASSPASPWAWAARSAAPRPPATASSTPCARPCKLLGIDITKATARRPGLRQRRPVRRRSCSRRYGGKVDLRVLLGPDADQKSYTFRKKAASTYEELLGITDKFGGIDKAKAKALGYEVLPGDAWIEQDVDILIPAAIENQVTGENVNKHRARGEDRRRGRQRPDHARGRRGAPGARHLRDPRLPVPTPAGSPAATSSRSSAT
ncbi:MAG: hypothetical protein MZV64_67995 [Ignavibacteriales bacterium]|nr:hypothetical protein [Ignavibacteriales bacterium]